MKIGPLLAEEVITKTKVDINIVDRCRTASLSHDMLAVLT